MVLGFPTVFLPYWWSILYLIVVVIVVVFAVHREGRGLTEEETTGAVRDGGWVDQQNNSK